MYSFWYDHTQKHYMYYFLPVVSNCKILQMLNINSFSKKKKIKTFNHFDMV